MLPSALYWKLLTTTGMVRPKKHLGQHFLTDPNIARKIADSVLAESGNLIEIGPGTGVLSKFLLERNLNFIACEIDTESVEFLNANYPALKVVSEDFLHLNPKRFFEDDFTVAGNFPYNISGPILFRVYDLKDQIEECTGMFQKEFAERVTAQPRTKAYGILSVLMQAFYHSEYLFTVSEHVFNPPPKVKSGVIRLKRKENHKIQTPPKFFKTIVKAGFNQRRKTLRNALKSFILTPDQAQHPYFSKRAEELTFDQFDELASMLNPGK